MICLNTGIRICSVLGTVYCIVMNFSNSDNDVYEKLLKSTSEEEENMVEKTADSIENPLLNGQSSTTKPLLKDHIEILGFT